MPMLLGKASGYFNRDFSAILKDLIAAGAGEGTGEEVTKRASAAVAIRLTKLWRSALISHLT